MNLILLPGNSPSNRPWIERLSGALADSYPNQHIQYYRHWDAEQGDESVISFQFEVEKLMAAVADMENYSVVAKSAGVLLTLKAANERNFTPKKCVFLGTPIPWGRTLKLPIENWFQHFKIPSLYIQQQNDPAMSAEQLGQYLKNAAATNYGVKEILGDDHEYQEVGELVVLIKEFIS